VAIKSIISMGGCGQIPQLHAQRAIGKVSLQHQEVLEGIQASRRLCSVRNTMQMAVTIATPPAVLQDGQHDNYIIKSYATAKGLYNYDHSPFVNLGTYTVLL
jgi:hypothetical protein